MDAAGSLRGLIRGYAVIAIAMVAAAVGVTRVLDHRLHRDVTLYSATARVHMDSPDPKSLPEAIAVSDAARAIVTSPNHVTAALKAVGVNRDVEDVAQNHITVQPLGSSQVVQLTVSDRVPAVASGLANALANDVVATREQSANAETNRIVAGLDARLGSLRQQIAQVNAQLANVNNTIDVSTPGGRQQLAGATEALRTQLDTLTRDAVALQSERDSVELAAAQRPKATVVEPAALPTQPDFPRWYLDVLLAGVGGLVLAVLLAALLEVVRPTVRGATAVARLFDAPILGERPFWRRGRARALAWMAMRLRLAADTARVDTVELVAVEIGCDLDAVCEELNLALGVEGTAARQADAASSQGTPVDVRPRPTGRIASLSSTRGRRAYSGGLLEAVQDISDTAVTTVADDGRNGRRPHDDDTGELLGRPVASTVAAPRGAVPLASPRLVVRPFRPGTAGLGRGGVGIVVVAPKRLQRQSAEPVVDLVALTRWPVLGVVLHPRWRPLPLTWHHGGVGVDGEHRSLGAA